MLDAKFVTHRRNMEQLRYHIGLVYCWDFSVMLVDYCDIDNLVQYWWEILLWAD